MEQQPGLWSAAGGTWDEPIQQSAEAGRQGQVKEQQEWPRLGGQGSPAAWSWPIGAERGDRWVVWRRLQELDIPCTCRADRPLLVTVSSPLAVWQIWHVLWMQGEPAPLRDWLERCYEAAL